MRNIVKFGGLGFWDTNEFFDEEPPTDTDAASQEA